eukprot:1195601-Prorocentrum_minimum.AAC.2
MLSPVVLSASNLARTRGASPPSRVHSAAVRGVRWYTHRRKGSIGPTPRSRNDFEFKRKCVHAAASIVVTESRRSVPARTRGKQWGAQRRFSPGGASPRELGATSGAHKGVSAFPKMSKIFKPRYV